MQQLAFHLEGILSWCLWHWICLYDNIPNRLSFTKKPITIWLLDYKPAVILNKWRLHKLKLFLKNQPKPNQNTAYENKSKEINNSLLVILWNIVRIWKSSSSISELSSVHPKTFVYSTMLDFLFIKTVLSTQILSISFCWVNEIHRSAEYLY